MKLEEAIEVLEAELKEWEAVEFAQLPNAMKLGIEALKRLNNLRTEKVFRAGILLPGETEEVKRE